MVAAMPERTPDPQVVPYLLYADAGATVSEISIRANQARSYTIDDPEGHRWYFSEPLS